MTTVIIDTNVILVANRQHADVSEDCILACGRRLQQVMASGRFAVDDAYRIVKEYQHKTTPYAAKRVGDVFLKWLLQNLSNPSRCDRVSIVEHGDRGFESFPDDHRLTGFDPPDRKFVAVAGAHDSHPPISQAADSKWRGWATALGEHGITVDFLCPADIDCFAAKKARKKKP
jgi:hypothetical protein